MLLSLTPKNPYSNKVRLIEFVNRAECFRSRQFAYTHGSAGAAKLLAGGTCAAWLRAIEYHCVFTPHITPWVIY